LFTSRFPRYDFARYCTPPPIEKLRKGPSVNRYMVTRFERHLVKPGVAVPSGTLARNRSVSGVGRFIALAAA